MGNTLDGFVQRLENNDPELVEINCASEGIVNATDEDATNFAIALAYNKTLESLDLSGLKIGDLWAEKLAYALILNDTLRVLRLHKNKIDDAGAERLVTAMRHNHTITSLYIAMNAILDPNINEDLQALSNMNKLGAEEAARQKAELYTGWAGEGIKLRRQAEAELWRKEPAHVVPAPAASQEENNTEFTSLISHRTFAGHQKDD